MRLWIVTSIRPLPGVEPRASTIQNLMTACALAEAGARVLLWTRGADPAGLEWLSDRLGRSFPANLRFLSARVAGEGAAKKTPFAREPLRTWNLLRAAVAHGGRPDAILTRSPAALARLASARGGVLLPRKTRLVLEWQYPESCQTWRAWRRRRPEATLGEAVRAMRSFRAAEAAGVRLADGVLRAATGHEALARRLGLDLAGRAAPLPSGCLAPEPGPTPSDAEFDAGYVGSLAPENGVEALIRAVGAMGERRLLIVGGGSPDRVERVRRAVAELPPAPSGRPRVEFEGAIPFREVRGRMLRCRVGVVPVSARHGPEKRQYASPLKLIEWMAAGAAVVASDVASVRERARAGGARLAAPDDPVALAEAIEATLRDETARKAAALAGLREAEGSTFAARAERILAMANGLG